MEDYQYLNMLLFYILGWIVLFIIFSIFVPPSGEGLAVVLALAAVLITRFIMNKITKEFTRKL